MLLLSEIIGWDIGGAHLKACRIADGVITAVEQRACPLWLGMDRFHAAAGSILDSLSVGMRCEHVITMTGELVDLFSSREEGVFSLTAAMAERVGGERLRVFAGHEGFVPFPELRPNHVGAVASANWLATGLYVATRVLDGLLIDIGSTTTDLLLMKNGQVNTRGYTDYERMRYDELVYCGIIRTPLMSLDNRAPFQGEWIGLMAEHFATTADVYRLTGELPESADQMPAADGGKKDTQGSARRIARLVGRDVESAQTESWRRVAGFFREQQLTRVRHAAERQLSRGLVSSDAPFVGAGIGCFLVQELANRLSHPYLSIDDLFPARNLGSSEFNVADCAPAAAVACLARQWPCMK